MPARNNYFSNCRKLRKKKMGGYNKKTKFNLLFKRILYFHNLQIA